jgi:hypothetical protein
MGLIYLYTFHFKKPEGLNNGSILTKDVTPLDNNPFLTSERLQYKMWLTLLTNHCVNPYPANVENMVSS